MAPSSPRVRYFYVLACQISMFKIMGINYSLKKPNNDSVHSLPIFSNHDGVIYYTASNCITINQRDLIHIVSLS